MSSTPAKPRPVPAAVRVRDTEWQRRSEYGECTAALVQNPEASGAEALFNQALSNGLAAIVAHHWPARERKRNGRVKSAADLLAIINREAPRRGNMRILPTPFGGLYLPPACRVPRARSDQIQQRLQVAD